MAGPLTPYELSGGTTFTTRDEGLAFMQQIAAETSAAYDVAGLTFQGRDIARLSIGTGPRVILVIGGVHGTEPVSREAVLRECRLFAYSPDSARSALLSDYTLMFVPTVNADRVLQGRNNAQNININRDYMQLDSPEATVITQIFAEHDPVVAIDAHETSSTLADLMPYPFKGPNAHLAINTASDALFEHVRAQAAIDGYTSAPYPGRPLTWLNGVAAMRNTVGILLETGLGAASLHRYAVMGSAFQAAWDWCAANVSAIDAATATAKAQLASGTYYSYFMLQAGDEDDSPGTMLSPVPSAYTLSASQAEAVEGHISAFNLETTVTGETVTISMAQQAAPMIPYLFDPDSLQAITVGERVYPPPPESGYWKATADGWVFSPLFRPRFGAWMPA